MNDCDALLRAVAAQAVALGIPISRQVAPHVEVNRRAVSRFGCCKGKAGRFTIEVAEQVALGPEASCRETLAHELLHTCQGCQNHGKRWQTYAAKMNAAYGYRISRASTRAALGVGEARAAKYILRCRSCGAELTRFRASRLTEHPEMYRCRCGGVLERIR